MITQRVIPLCILKHFMPNSVKKRLKNDSNSLKKMFLKKYKKVKHLLVLENLNKKVEHPLGLPHDSIYICLLLSKRQLG